MANDRNPKNPQSGQTLAEFVIVAGLATLVMAGAARWSLMQWHKVVCLRSVFETVHSSLLEATPGQSSVSGEQFCGRSRERLTLGTLESFRAGEL